MGVLQLFLHLHDLGGVNSGSPRLERLLFSHDLLLVTQRLSLAVIMLALDLLLDWLSHSRGLLHRLSDHEAVFKSHDLLRLRLLLHQVCVVILRHKRHFPLLIV